MPLSAQAATTSVTTGADLKSKIEGAVTAGTVFQLTQNIGSGNGSDSPLSYSPSTTLTIDLHGHSMRSQEIRLASGSTLTITDSTSTAGTLTATAATNNPGIFTYNATLIVSGTAQVVATGQDETSGANPGIGGTDGADTASRAAGNLTVMNSAQVTAVAGSGVTNGAAGIGGANLGQNGTVLIQDSAHVTATGSPLSDSTSTSGAGIGGGSGSYGGTVTIMGSAVVTATGGAGAAGIGGGRGNGMGAFTLSGSAQVIAIGGTRPPGTTHDASGIGDGAPLSGWGPTTNITISGGTLDIPTGSTLNVAQASLANGGEIVNNGSIIGDTTRTIANNGRILNVHGTIGVGVTNHNYAIALTTNGGQLAADAPSSLELYATTLDSGGLTLPTPTRAGFIFEGWTFVSNGSGSAITGSTTFTGSSTDGTGVPTNIYAAWQPKLASSVSVTVAPTTITAGGVAVATAVVTSGATGQVSFSVDGGSPFGAADAGTAAVTLPTSITAGTHTLTASYGGDATHLPSTGSATFVVAPVATMTAPVVSAGSTTPTTTPIAAAGPAALTHPKLTVTAKKFSKDHRPKLTAAFSRLAKGQKVSGKIAIYVGSKKVATVTISKKTSVTVTLPKKYAKSVSVSARFLGSSTIAKTSSKTVRVRVK